MSEVSALQPKVSGFDSDPLLVRNTFAKFPSGVVAVAATLASDKHVLVASSFMVGVSLEPCLVSLAVQKSSTTWEVLKDLPSLGVSVLGTGQESLTRKLANKDRARRFEDVATEVSESGAVFLYDAAVWFECSIHNVAEAGDHWMVMLEVHKLGLGENHPLIWYNSGFREITDAQKP